MKLLTLGIIQVNLVLHSLTRNIVSVGVNIAGSTAILLPKFLLYHLQQTLKRIEVSWVGIDIEQVAVAVNEPVLE